MAKAITQFKILVVDKNISVGLKQLNQHIADMQIDEHAEILNITRQNNVYHILYHITPISKRVL